jgi:phage tail-like protein
MAESMWGKSPPKGKSQISPDMIKESFWGPAEVPDQVRGQPRVTTWVSESGEWMENEVQDAPETAHDSWVGGETKAGTAQYEDEITGGIEGGYMAGAREQGAGDPDSWVGGETKAGTEVLEDEITGGIEGGYMAGARAQGAGETGSESAIANQSGEGPSSSGGMAEGETPSSEGEFSAEGNSLAGARTQGAGDADSWLAPLLPQFFPSSAKESTSLGTSGGYMAEGRAQGAGEAESGVGGETKAGTGVAAGASGGASAVGSWRALGRLQQGAGSASAAGSARKQGAGEADSWLGGATDSTSQSGNAMMGGTPDFADFEKDAIKSDNLPAGPAGGGGGGAAVQSSTGNVNYTPSGAESEFDGPVDARVGAWNFKVEIDGIAPENSGLLTISGITTETEPIEFKFGPDPFMRSMPGRTKFSDVELTRVYKMGSDEFYKWRQRIEAGVEDYRNVTIHLHSVDVDSSPVMSMTLHECYPVKWECPEMNAGGSDGAIEKISLDVTRVTTAVGGAAPKKKKRKKPKRRKKGVLRRF